MGLLFNGQLFSMFLWGNFAVLTLDISNVISYAFWEDLQLVHLQCFCLYFMYAHTHTLLIIRPVFAKLYATVQFSY